MNTFDDKSKLEAIYSCRVEDLIVALQQIQEKYDNLRVIFWDQNSAVKMKVENAVQVIDGCVFFGGFHCNGEKFEDFEEM